MIDTRPTVLLCLSFPLFNIVYHTICWPVLSIFFVIPVIFRMGIEASQLYHQSIIAGRLILSPAYLPPPTYLQRPTQPPLLTHSLTHIPTDSTKPFNSPTTTNPNLTTPPPNQTNKNAPPPHHPPPRPPRPLPPPPRRPNSNRHPRTQRRPHPQRRHAQRAEHPRTAGAQEGE